MLSRENISGKHGGYRKRIASIAPVPFYSKHYTQEKLPDGSVLLSDHLTALKGEDAAPAGTDAEAVLKGYISIGKVKGVIF